MLKEDLMMAEDVFVFPSSFAQQRLWLLDQLQPGDPTYNIAAAVRLKGRLEIDAVKSSLNKVVERHETLRTTFMIVEDELVQVVAQDLKLPLPVIDLRSLPEQEREAEFRSFADQEAQRPFDLARGPLVRCVLMKLNDEEHVLLLVMHHIISDGWSVGILIAELSALYRAHISGEDVQLPQLPIQYADYAAWQRGWLQGEVLESQLAYWKDRLTGAPGVLELPADYARPPVQTFRSASVTLELPDALSQSLKTLSRRKGITLFMTLLAGFNVLLHRYTGLDNIVLGSPIAGRDRAEVKGLIGCFLNLLVLRTELSGNPSFDELLERVRRTTTGAYAHQDLPFEKLLEELQPERDLSRAPLFQVFFNMLNLPEHEISLPGLSVELLTLRDVGSKFDVTLYVRELGRKLVFELVFKADLFSPERMTETLRQYEHLLSQVVMDPQKQISEYSLVTPAAEKLLPLPAEQLNNAWLGSVPEIFSKQAEQAPERLAIIDRHETWTYRELRALSNQLAHYLHAQGIQNEDIVAIYGHRSSALVWALMGVLKAGAAFTILDPAYPSARLIEYLQLAKPQGLINLAPAGPFPIELKEFVEGRQWCVKLRLPQRAIAQRQYLFADYSTSDPEISINPDDLAYVSFTSGSTGKPKGVQGRHGPLTHFLPWLQREFGLDENDNYTMLSALGHDPLHRDVFTPLQLGACICIPTQQDIESTGRIAEWMKDERVTIAHLTPAMGQLLTETAGGSAPCQVPSLRYAFLVGDVLTRRDVAKLRQLAPKIRCVNYYGSTETQRAVSYFKVSNNGKNLTGAGTSIHAKEILPLGKGIEDVQLLLLNNAGHLAGVGEVGEINLRSPHIARGYMGDDALTQERFIKNPFTKTAGDRLYRTGDLGRYLPDGNVEPLGRADHQVKIRGFRVELGEVEAALGTHAGVREAVVITREDSPGDKRLVAYYVVEPATTPTSGELRQFLKERLPDYMIPSAFVSMERMPLTPNKKIDRRALPEPLQTESASNTGYASPTTTVERKLSNIWAGVLKLERVGLHDNFFELGGHSLLAIRLIARVREEFDIELRLREFFESPTVAQVACQVERLLESKPLSRLPAPKPVARTGELPLSFSQQRLWFVDQLEPGNPAYNIFAAVHLAGPLDVAALEQSINEVFRRHEIIRTSFAAVDGRPVSVISLSGDTSLPVENLSEILEEERAAEITSRAVAESRRSFDLTRAPLVRASLLLLGKEEHVLLLTMHHIISDGWSIGVILREMASLYEAFSNGQPSPLVPLPIQYADYAYWQREWLRGEVLDTQMGFWREQLANIPSMTLLTDRPRQDSQSYRGAFQFRKFPAQAYEALKTLSRKEGVTVFVTLLAAFDILLRRHTGQNDLVVGSPIAGRNLIETEGLIGFFANTLLLRSDLSGDPTFRELLERVREVTLNAYANQDLPFERIVEELQPERRANYMPLAQVQFSLQDATEVVEVRGLKMTRLTIDKGTAMFDLVLNMSETVDGLSGRMEYRTDLFDATTINRMLTGYEMLLNAVSATPDARLSELEGMLIEADEQQMATETKKQQETLLWKLKHIERKSIAVSLPQ